MKPEGWTPKLTPTQQAIFFADEPKTILVSSLRGSGKTHMAALVKKYASRFGGTKHDKGI